MVWEDTDLVISLFYERGRVKVKNKKDVTKISNTHGAEVINSASNQHYLRCLDVYPKGDKDLLLAIGHSNGKITLTTFGQLDWDSKVLPGKDLVPKFPRPCSSVHFNPVESHLLAAGLEKYKPDNCIMIWAGNS